MEWVLGVLVISMMLKMLRHSGDKDSTSYVSENKLTCAVHIIIIASNYIVDEYNPQITYGISLEFRTSSSMCSGLLLYAAAASHSFPDFTALELSNGSVSISSSYLLYAYNMFTINSQTFTFHIIMLGAIYF